MAISYGEKPLVELLKLSRQRRLVLPNFQRPLVWERKQQKKLVSSIFAGVPMGAVLILQGKRGEYASKPLGFDGDVYSTEDCQYLLDGQQRLSVLKSVFADTFSLVENDALSAAVDDPGPTSNNAHPKDWVSKLWDRIATKLRNRWFLQLDAVDTSIDVFGFKNLVFPKANMMEPSDYDPFVQHKDIYKGSLGSDWFSPSFAHDNDGQSSFQKRQDIIDRAARANCVPLWELFDNSDEGLHIRVLERISDARAVEIHAAWMDGKIPDADVSDTLRPENPDIKVSKSENSDGVSAALKVQASRWCRQFSNYLTNLLEHYKVPIIDLPPEEIHRGIAIFETINRGGTPLTVFDLILARYARSNPGKSLSDEIRDHLSNEMKIPDAIWLNNKNTQVSEWKPSTMRLMGDELIMPNCQKLLVNLFGLVAQNNLNPTQKADLMHIKRDWILRLSDEQVARALDDVCTGFIRAMAFLQFRCGVVSLGSMQYELMGLPIAMALISDENWKQKGKISKIEYWYWVSVFAGRYRERQNERCISDVDSLQTWLSGGSNPYEKAAQDVLNIDGYSNEGAFLFEDVEGNISSNVNKTFLQYVLSHQPRDIIDGDCILSAWDAAIDGDIVLQDHHLVPLFDATEIKESTANLRKNKSHILNSAANRTLIKDVSNRIIGTRNVDKYFNNMKECNWQDHYIPAPIESSFVKKAEEQPNEFYQRALRGRYQTVKATLTAELQNLLSQT